MNKELLKTLIIGSVWSFTTGISFLIGKKISEKSIEKKIKPSGEIHLIKKSDGSIEMYLKMDGDKVLKEMQNREYAVFKTMVIDDNGDKYDA